MDGETLWGENIYWNREGIVRVISQKNRKAKYLRKDASVLEKPPIIHSEMSSKAVSSVRTPRVNCDGYTRFFSKSCKGSLVVNFMKQWSLNLQREVQFTRMFVLHAAFSLLDYWAIPLRILLYVLADRKPKFRHKFSVSLGSFVISEVLTKTADHPQKKWLTKQCHRVIVRWECHHVKENRTESDEKTQFLQ